MSSPEVQVSLHRAAPPGSPPGTRPRDVVIRLDGEANLATAPGLRADLAWALGAAGTHVVLDLTGLTFCDLSGLDALTAFDRGAHHRGQSVSWRGASRQLAWLCAVFGDHLTANPRRVHAP